MANPPAAAPTGTASAAQPGLAAQQPAVTGDLPVAPQPPQAKPEAVRDLKPETSVEPKIEPKPEPKSLDLKPPALIAPKDAEVPAEPRALAKPDAGTEPLLAKPAEPAIPAKPPMATEPLPVAPAPPKLDEPKPEAPSAPGKKDDPFGARNDVKPLRMWTDASGKYQLEARFVSCEEGTVRLQKADGRYYRIKYDRLSVTDQDFVGHQGRSLIAAQ